MSRKAKYYAESTGSPARRRRRKRRREEEKERKIPSWVYRVAVVLIVAVTGLVLWVNRDGLTPENMVNWVQERVVGLGIGDGYPVPITGSQVMARNFISENGEITMVSDTHLTTLNSTGKELCSRQHSFSFPVLRLAGGRSLVYNLGGKGYQIETRTKTILRGDADGNILGGAVASNGHYALLTENTDYLGRLTVYTETNEKQYEYSFSSCYPAAAALSTDGSQALVCGVYAEGGAFASSLYLIDLNSSQTVEPAASFPETTPVDAFWYGDGSAAAVGDKLTAVVTPSGSVVQYGYGGWLLNSYAGADGITAIGLSPYSNAASGKLVLLDSSGSEKRSIPLSGEPDAVSLSGNTVAVLVDGIVYAYSIADGVLFAQAEAGEDAVSIALANESSVYILGVSEIRTASLNG